MLLNSLLDRSSTVIMKLGMPLVYFYHLILTSITLTTAADDATGLEKMANQLLTPTYFILDGKRATPHYDLEGNRYYLLDHHFDYSNHFFMKTTAAYAALPISIAIGIPLKLISHALPEGKQRHQEIVDAIHSTAIHLNNDYYRKIGMDLHDDYSQAERISAPAYLRQEGEAQPDACDVEALREIVRILNHHKIPFWIDCGTCLGAYRHGGMIPHDWDIDIALFATDFHNVSHALQELDPQKYAVQDWSGRNKPDTYLKVFVKESNALIDLYNFGFDAEKKELFTILSNEHNVFLPKSWKIREKRYTTPMPFENVFPRKIALFEGIEVPVPGKTKEYLQVFYGEDLSPIRTWNPETRTYEKIEDHPYWQLPHAH
jgi:hypothetical protein